jgi:hypothetical protein
LRELREGKSVVISSETETRNEIAMKKKIFISVEYEDKELTAAREKKDHLWDIKEEAGGAAELKAFDVAWEEYGALCIRKRDLGKDVKGKLWGSVGLEFENVENKDVKLAANFGMEKLNIDEKHDLVLGKKYIE